MDATTSALLREIGTNLEPLKNLNNPFYLDPNFLGALLASIVALIIAIFSEQLKNLRRTTKIVVEGIRSNEQGNGNSVHYRLAIVNRGNYPARDVEVYVDKVSEDNVERKNFLPVPLVWTHAPAYMTAGVYRNIHPNQHVLLDFCELIKNKNLLILKLAAGGEVPDYSILHGGNTEVTLKIYQESGRTVGVKLLISYNPNQDLRISIL